MANDEKVVKPKKTTKKTASKTKKTTKKEPKAWTKRTRTEDEIKDIVKSPTRLPNPNGSLDVNVEEGDNNKYLIHNLKVFNLPPCDRNNYEQLSARITEYFQICAEDDMKPTVNGLALAIGIDRDTLRDYAIEKRKIPPECRDIIRKAYNFMTNMWESYMTNGKINPASGIFLAKNHFGYVDEVKVVAERGAERPSDEELIKDAKALSDSLDDDTTYLPEP